MTSMAALAAAACGSAHWRCHKATCVHVCCKNYIPDDCKSKNDYQSDWDSDEEDKDEDDDQHITPGPVRAAPAVSNGPRTLADWRRARDVINVPGVKRLILQHFSPADLSGLVDLNAEWGRIISDASFRKALFLEADHTPIRAPIRDQYHNRVTVRNFHDVLFRRTDNDLWDMELHFNTDPLAVDDNDPLLDAFITQPPATDADVTIALYRHEGPTEAREAQTTNANATEELSVPGGIRYRDVVPKMQEVLERDQADAPRGEFVDIDLYGSFVDVKDACVDELPMPMPGWIRAWKEKSTTLFGGRIED